MLSPTGNTELLSLKVRGGEVMCVCKAEVLCWKTSVYFSFSCSQGFAPREQFLPGQKKVQKLVVDVQGELTHLQSKLP